MEELQELLNEIKEGTSATQSAVSKLERRLKELIEEKSAQMESPELESIPVPVSEEITESVDEETKVEANEEIKPEVKEDIPLESPELLPINEPVIDELNLNDEKEETDVKTEEISESHEESNAPLLEEVPKSNEELLEIKAYKQGPSNVSEIKGYFTSEKLKATIDGYEETPSLPIEPISMNVQEEQPISSADEEEAVESEMASENVQEPVEEQHNLVMPNEIASTQVGEELPSEEPEIKSDPEAVAQNLANNLSSMKTVEEILASMDLEGGKGR